MDYFITQVGLAAASFGVAKDDITVVANALNTTFNVACAPAAAVIKAQGPQLQAICINQTSCAKAKDGDCSKYANVVMPQNATMTGTQTMMPTATNSGSMTMSSGATGTQSGATSSPTSTGAAAANGLSFAAVAAGLAAFML